jgi:hypothetical protein
MRCCPSIVPRPYLGPKLPGAAEWFRRPGRETKKMKITAIVISLACLSQAALADELSTPTPSPTTVYINPLGRRGEIRRAERRNALQSAADSRAQTRAKGKADRVAAETAQAQAKQAARAREQAQREVTAENRREGRNEKPHLKSDLMTRMGFSEQQIAEQKAREQSANPGSKAATDTASPHP